MRRFEVNSRKPCGQSDRCEVIGSGSAPASFHSHFSEESSVIVWGGFQWRAGDSWGVKPLSWLALEGGSPDTSAGRCSPTPRRARGFLSAGGDALHAGSIPSVVSSPFACSLLD